MPTVRRQQQYQQQQRAATEYKLKNLMQLAQSAYANLPWPAVTLAASRDTDGVGLKLTKYTGKPDDNFDAWYMTMVSAIRTCQ